MDENAVWDYIKKFYLDHYGIPEKVVDFIAVSEILRASCSGISNIDISKILNVSPLYVRDVLIEFLDFTGWNYTIDISPLLVYNRVKGNRELFNASLMAVSSIVGRQNIDKAYSICNKLDEIGKEIDKYYE